MKPSLEHFNVPVAEFYVRDWGYYGIYLRTTPATTKPLAAALVTRASTFLGTVSLAILSQLGAQAMKKRSRGAFEGHPRYRKHLDRERDTGIALEAKIRDGYQCRVCRLNFEQVYGPLGHAYAEAHHIVPLSQLSKPRRNSPSDLVTLCSNCHRMLHRLPVASASVATLRRRFTGNWPS